MSKGDDDYDWVAGEDEPCDRTWLLVLLVAVGALLRLTLW